MGKPSNPIPVVITRGAFIGRRGTILRDFGNFADIYIPGVIINLWSQEYQIQPYPDTGVPLDDPRSQSSRDLGAFRSNP